MKRGLKPHTPDRRDLRLANYLAPLPKPPAQFGHGDVVEDWGVLGNDEWGDCFWAGAAHETMLLGRLGGHKPEFSDQSVLDTYGTYLGAYGRAGLEAKPSLDQGTEPREGARYRAKNGVTDSRGQAHRIGAYLWLERGDVEQLEQALYIFQVVGAGFELPQSAEEQFSREQTWDVVRGSPILGGHYVPLIGKNALGPLEGVSWGQRVLISADFYRRYNQASLVYVSASQLKDGKTPEGFSKEQLLEDLNALKGTP